MAMGTANGAIEILLDAFEWQGEGGAAPDQHIIMPGLNARSGVEPHDLAQAAAHTIAFHRIADFFGDGEAEACRARIGAALGLQNESRSRYFDPGCGGQKIRPLPQSFHRHEAGRETR